MKLFAKFGAIFVTSQSVVLSLCKIKRLNSNSFVLRLRYLQILFPPWFPLFQQPILCCVPLLGFMVSAPRFKIQSYCPLFSLCWGRIRFTNHKKINYHTKTRQSKQCGFSIYIFDNSKSKSMVRSEKMALSGLVFARKIARMILIQNI